jgi:hypothetical protein
VTVLDTRRRRLSAGPSTSAARRPVGRSATRTVPEIRSARYDECSCGLPRFVHEGRPLSWNGLFCAGTFRSVSES